MRSAWPRPNRPLTSAEILARNRAVYRRQLATFAELAARRDVGWWHDAIAAALPPGATLLDAGCGTGDDAWAFRARGLQVQAFDASSAMVRHCRARGIAARRQTLQRFVGRKNFDAVWAAACLLHIPRREIDDVLRRLVGALRPGGLFYASLWYGRGEGFVADGRFVARYTRAEFTRRLEATGTLRIVRAWRSPAPAGSGQPQWIHVLAQRAGNSP